MKRTDINHVAETLLIPLFREVYGYTNLKNLNTEEANYPAIDLGDEVARVAIQITSSAGSRKIQDTLSKFVSNKLYEKYDRLIVYILIKKQRSYGKVVFEQIIQDHFKFDIEQDHFKFDSEQDILDFTDILAQVATFSVEQTHRIERILEANFGPSDTQFPALLAEHMLTRQFEAHINERTQGFVGRNFIFQGIDNVLNDSDFPSGYIVIRGEPGIGKTALMAQLVKLRGYVHHFNIASQNIRSARVFIGNICAQLIVRYQLDYTSLPNEAMHGSGFLSQVLSEASAKTSENIVILVDALDEAEDVPNPNSNRLFLPESLPPGVFFLVTTRERHADNLSVSRRADIYLRDDDPQNLEDVRFYINNYIADNRQRMEAQIAKWHLTQDDFTSALTDKSQGNFMYLVHVLRDIRDEKLTVSNIDSVYDLPVGLRGYYQRHWGCMHAENPGRFQDYLEPIICILAAVPEPLPISQIVRWTGKQWPQLDPMTIQEVLHTWREFLNEDRQELGPPRYWIYHTSFQDFLAEEVGLSSYYSVIGGQILSRIKWPAKAT